MFFKKNRFETSAKDNIGIDKAAKFLITKILENKVTEKPPDIAIVKPGTNDKVGTETGKPIGCCK